MDELLKILQSNALESREAIARMLGVPVADVAQRIAEYEKAGVIRGYQAILNEDRLDLDKVTAVIEVKVTPQREGGFDNIAERISRFPEVRSTYLMSGAYDLLLFVEGRNLREAVVHACRIRLRPILMTSLATVVGLLPMAFKLETGSEAYAPLARVIIGHVDFTPR